MDENRDEQRDGEAPGARRRTADTDAQQPPGTGEAGQQVTNAGTSTPIDPDLARRAERAEPSRQASRLEYDPADEEG